MNLSSHNKLVSFTWSIANSEKSAILNAISWYDASAEKVVKDTTKLAGDKLEQLLDHLRCAVNQLADYHL